MKLTGNRPLIVQGDGSLLLDTHEKDFDTARGEISAYAELEKSPEHMHTYRLTPLSLWNAASSGWDSQKVINSLSEWTRYPLPENVKTNIQETISKWGIITLELPENRKSENLTDSDLRLLLKVKSKAVFEELKARKNLAKWLTADNDFFTLKLVDRGTIKAELLKIGLPVVDNVPMKAGKPLDFSLKETTETCELFKIRDYQKDAVKAFLGNNQPGTGYGTVVMPCGSGKTIVGISAMAELKTYTLIVTTNVASVHQWKNELLDKTTLKEDDIAEYTGDKKGVAPVTIATYQILTWRKDKQSPFPHFDLFRKHPWGLIIYDEVHLLPAPVFRVTAEIQAIRRLGLTATLIREDGAEKDVFSLVGPKRFDIPWKDLESSGWIAEAECVEIRIDLPPDKLIPYAMADKRKKVRIAAENPVKLNIVKQLVENHPEDHILVIGQYITQLESAAKLLNAPLITGKTPNPEREKIYNDFREGTARIIVVSKVANFAIDLPDASVAIQISGSFGSRQEEAQRLGRILRPKERNSWFFSLVSRNTVEEEFAANRQRFLTEQGYKYKIDIWKEE